MAAALDRPALGGRMSSRPMPLPLQRVADPEILDEQPAGVGLAREAGDDRLAVAREDGKRLPFLMARPAALVESFEPVRQNLDVRSAGLIVDVEAKANFG